MSDTVIKDSEAEVQYPPSILEDVTKLVQRVQTFTGATGAAIALREGEDMICRASRGNNAPDVGMMLNLDGTFTGLAVTGMKAVRCDDTENDSRVDPEVSRALRIKSMAVVPVLSGMRVSGVIATFSSSGNAFSDTHMAVLKTMADGLGATILRWMEGQGIAASAAAPAKPQPMIVPPQPKVEAPRPTLVPPPAPKIEPPQPPPPPRVEAPKPIPVPPPAPKLEPPAPKLEPPAPKPMVAATAAAAAAAPAPEVEKAPEKKEPPKKIEPKQQGKWKPVVAPKQEEAPVEEAKPVAKAEPKPEPKPVISAPAFSYEAEPEGKKSPLLIGGIAAAVLVVAAGGYFMFGRGGSKPTTSTPTVATQPASNGSTTAEPAASTTTAAATPATTTASAKPDASKPTATADKTKPQLTQVADTTTVSKPAPAPLVVAPTPVAPKQTADVAPPTIALGGGAGPNLVPISTSAPKLSAPAPANAVIVPSRLVSRVNPSYPSAARQYRIEGAVTLSATIGPDGHVHDAKVLSGPPMLRDAAVSAVRQWKYAPSTVNGRAVESSVQIVLDFKMPS